MSQDLFQSDSPAGVDFYARMARIYDPLAGPFLRPVRRAVNAVAGDCGCGRILDIGCGTGEQAQMLAARGISTTGIDLSPAMLAKARERLKQIQVEQAFRPESNPAAMGQAFQPALPSKLAFVRGNGEKLPFAPASFDCALISLALHEMSYSTAIRLTGEALRVLVPGGRLILFDYIQPRDFTSKISIAMLHLIERFAGKIHFMNFKYFIERGGLHAFLKEFPLSIVSSRLFFGGAIGLVVAETRG